MKHEKYVIIESWFDVKEMEARIIHLKRCHWKCAVFGNNTFNAENMVQIKGLKCQEKKQCIGVQFSYIFNKVLRNTWKVFLDSVVFFVSLFLTMIVYDPFFISISILPLCFCLGLK